MLKRHCGCPQELHEEMKARPDYEAITRFIGWQTFPWTNTVRAELRNCHACDSTLARGQRITPASIDGINAEVTVEEFISEQELMKEALCEEAA